MQVNKEEIEKSLDVIGTYFGSIKDACVDGFYEIETNRLSRIEEIIRCIKLYVILKGIKKLTGRKLEVLAYYLQDGFSKDTKKDIINLVGITDSNLNNINHELRKMGVIQRVGYNNSNNEVNPDLLQFKKFIIDDRKNFVLINLV